MKATTLIMESIYFFGHRLAEAMRIGFILPGIRCSVTIAKKSSNQLVGRLYVNRNPNGGCNVPKVAKFLDE